MMEDEEIWELARKPVTEFIDSIKQMDLNVEKLIQFYMKHTVASQAVVTRAKSHPTHEQSQDAVDESYSCPTGDMETLSPLSKAKLELAIVFAINACYWMYLITHGEHPRDHEISRDIERVGLFMKRAKEIEESIYGSSNKRPKIDREASKRICMNNMSLKSSWD